MSVEPSSQSSTHSLEPNTLESNHQVVSGVALSQVFTRDPVIWLMIATFAIVSFVFYNTEFRDVLEDWFFDGRAKWSIRSTTVDDIAVVAIDEKAIEVLDASQTRLQFDGKKKPYLSIDSLIHIAGLLSNSNAVATALLIPNHAFPHSDERLAELTEIVRYDQRMMVGTTEYNRTEPGVAQIPFPLKSIEDRVFGYETFRKRSNVVVRSLPYMGFRGLEQELMLPVQMASSIAGNYGELSGNYIINPLKPSAFKTINAGLALTDPAQFMDAVNGKTVIVGYTVNREIPYQTTDVMSVNTPLVGNKQNTDQGISTTYLTANAVENLIHNRYLKPANSVFNFIQTLAVAILCGLAWELGSFFAGVFTVAFWLTLVSCHSLIFSHLNYIVPLADTFLVSALVSIFAAVRRLKVELREMAVQEAQAESKEEIARMQSLFLNDFATWLMNLTGIIVQKVRATQAIPHGANIEDNTELYQRAYSAGEDFREYLSSIRQLPSLENVEGKLEREQIDLEDFLKRITRRFDLKLYNKRVTVELELSTKAKSLKANYNLLDSIVFNFLSNAVKYAPEGSTILIRSSRTRDRSTVISVLDEGPGIPEELREKIFEKFYRIQAPTHYQSKGTGLGLYLCRFFAERMRGRVDVRPRPNGGSEFRVILP